MAAKKNAWVDSLVGKEILLLDQEGDLLKRGTGVLVEIDNTRQLYILEIEGHKVGLGFQIVGGILEAKEDD